MIDFSKEILDILFKELKPLNITIAINPKSKRMVKIMNKYNF